MSPMEKLRELTAEALVAQQRHADAKERAKEAKAHLDEVLAQIVSVAYQVSHGGEVLPFDDDDEDEDEADAPPKTMTIEVEHLDEEPLERVADRHARRRQRA